MDMGYTTVETKQSDSNTSINGGVAIAVKECLTRDGIIEIRLRTGNNTAGISILNAYAPK